MNNLYTILKYSFINNSKINNFKKGDKKEKAKMLSLGILIGFSFIMILAMITGYYMLMVDGLLLMGMMDLILGTAIIGAISVTFLTSIYKAQGILFGIRDFDMLISMPISSGQLLSAKIIELLVLNYAFAIGILAPAFGVYYVNVSASPTFILYSIIGILLIPLIPIVLASIIAFILTNISNKFKGKNLFIILGVFVVIILIMIGSYKMNEILGYLINNSGSIIIAINKFYPPAALFIEALSEGNLASFGIFVTISLGIFAVFILVFGKAFVKINSRNMENYKKGNYKVDSLKSSSITRALFNKELKRYFSSPMYVLNTAMGPILITTMSIIAFVFGGEKILELMEMQGSTEMMPLLTTAMVCGAILISCTTNSSISLEGKNLWILKSLPIDIMDIFKAKIAVNLSILIPTVIINGIIFLIALDLSMIEFMWIIILPTICSLITAMYGLIINLYMPNLSWTNEMVVIKQSAAVMISVFSGFAIIGIPIGAFILLDISNVTMYLATLALVGIIVIFIMYGILKKKGRELFLKL